MTTIRQSVRSIYILLQETYESWREDRAIRLGAGLAYYAVFAAVPLLSSAIGVAGIVFSEAQIKAFLVESLELILSNVPDDTVGFVTRLADSVGSSEVSGGLALIGAVVAILGASLLFVALQDALNVIWDIPVRAGLRFTLRRRLIAFGIVLMAGAALVASIAVQAVALVVDQIFGGNIGEILDLNDLLVSVATWGLGWLAIALLFQLLIEEHLGWVNTLVVSALIGLLMILGTWLVGIYFGRWGTASFSGVSGGVVVVLTWFYYLAQIFIAGAELLKTLEVRTRRTQQAN